MKSLLKKFASKLLAIPTRILLFRLKPEVIAVTGSAGKTTTKEFLKTILSEDFDVLAAPEGYNTEIGAPLALFSQKIPQKLFSPFSWSWLYTKIFFTALFKKNFAEKVIIEMGADKTGDIKYLARLFKPKKGIVLSVFPVHLEEFKSVENIASEKAELVRAVDGNGTVFLNFDDVNVRGMANKTDGEVCFFGTDGEPEFKAQKISTGLSGTSFELLHDGKKTKAAVRIYGEQMIYPLLAAISVAFSENMSPTSISRALKKIEPFKGRMNVIEGTRESVIIDDSYNANPASTIEALEFLGSQKGRKIALLGNMNELGDYEREGHEAVGRKAAENADILITVGEVAQKYLAPEAEKNGLKNIKSFMDSREAGEYAKKIIRKGDVILAKGSQNMVRMENAVEAIMANPKDAEKVLVRQSKFWKEV